MRPSLLDPLFASAASLPGIGRKSAELLARIVPADTEGREVRVLDLLFVAPTGVIDRRNRPGVAAAPEGAIVTLELRVDRHQPPPPGKSNVPYRVYADDDTGEIALTFFNAKRAAMEKRLPPGANVLVSGRMEWFNGRPTMVHPDYIVPVAEASSLPDVEPVYPGTAGLSPKLLRRALAAALSRLPEVPEWVPAGRIETQNFPPFADSLTRLHHPRDSFDAQPASPAWRRLAYDEFLAGQIALALVRMRFRRGTGISRQGDGRLRDILRSTLPYSLTGSQERSIAEIAADLQKPERMLRLLQGDVGSGKTVVALFAAAQVAESGAQSAFLAPTEILARQHFATLQPLAARAGITIAILTGREKGKERERILAGLADGSIVLVVGTHALVQEGVAFANLGLAVIDEQHRFGVHQRLAFAAKGVAPDLLVMTATPIPRTLVLTAFGDMDVSRLTEKPAGRKGVRTVTLPFERIGELTRHLTQAVARGEKAFWICPLVEESVEAGDELVAAEERFAALAKLLPRAVGLVHGRMKGAEKDTAMEAFRTGETRVLVATTVVEVGVDVPDATIMVVENAERFGLAQLHQLRGRIGRGEQPGTCVLLYRAPLGETAHRRLEVLRETDDGFAIAEEDLKLRGEGELLGTRQSGVPGFMIARLDAHPDLLALARADARAILDENPGLSGHAGEAVRLLLYVFGRDEAVRLLAAG